MTTRRIPMAAAATCSALLFMTACTADPDSTASNGDAGDNGTAEPDSEVEIPTQELNEDLAERLPQEVQDSGVLVSVNTGSFPPYTVVDSGNNVTGASADLSLAIGELLGVDIEHTTIDGLASVLSGMDAGRYDLAIGPIGDFPERQEQATFIDWVQEFVVFAVPAGNPEGINSVEDTCGLRIAVQAAGSAEQVIQAQSETCVENGDPAVDVQSYRDQPSSLLAVQSGRADAFFSSQAPLTYFVDQSDGDLELAGVGEPNGFDDLYQGAVVPRDGEMAEIVLEAIEILHENGTYEAIMTKWGLEGNILETPGIDLAD